MRIELHCGLTEFVIRDQGPLNKEVTPRARPIFCTQDRKGENEDQVTGHNSNYDIRQSRFFAEPFQMKTHLSYYL